MPDFKRHGPADVEHRREGWRVLRVDRFVVEYHDEGCVAQIQIESGGAPGATIYADSLALVSPETRLATREERETIVPRLVRALGFMGRYEIEVR